jgi:hypothetical protein
MSCICYAEVIYMSRISSSSSSIHGLRAIVHSQRDLNNILLLVDSNLQPPEYKILPLPLSNFKQFLKARCLDHVSRDGELNQKRKEKFLRDKH